MKNKYIIICIAIICLSLSIFSINNLRSNSQKPPKTIGSESVVDRLPLDSVDTLVELSDLIVVGEVISDPQTKTIKVAPNDPNVNSYYKTANAQFKIDETLYGDPNIKEITFSQLGEAGNDYGETKVKKGEKYLLFVRKVKNDTYYVAIGGEYGIFKIDDQGKLLSLSNQAAVAKYDDKALNSLKEDLKNIIKKVKDK